MIHLFNSGQNRTKPKNQTVWREKLKFKVDFILINTSDNADILYVDVDVDMC